MRALGNITCLPDQSLDAALDAAQLVDRLRPLLVCPLRCHTVPPSSTSPGAVTCSWRPPGLSPWSLV